MKPKHRVIATHGWNYIVAEADLQAATGAGAGTAADIVVRRYCRGRRDSDRERRVWGIIQS